MARRCLPAAELSWCDLIPDLGQTLAEAVPGMTEVHQSLLLPA